MNDWHVYPALAKAFPTNVVSKEDRAACASASQTRLLLAQTS